VTASPETQRNFHDGIFERGRRVCAPATCLAVLLTAAHFLFLLSAFEPAISTPDANGYFAQARLIATQHRTFFTRESDVQFVGFHWRDAGGNRYHSQYPPGLPALAAPFYRMFGPGAALMVNPVMASLSILGVYFLCRMWTGAWWAVLAAALLALNPTANQYALSADSHTSTLFFLVWALFALARWEKTHSLPWAFAAGFLAGVIPAIRYPEALFAPAFMLFILLNTRRGRGRMSSLAAVSTGFAVPFGALLLHNRLAYGGFLKTGYDLMDIDFGWEYFRNHAPLYLQKLQGEGSGLLTGLGAAGIAAMCAGRGTWKRGLLFAGLAVPVTTLYMSYYWSPDRASMRFLMPTFPLYIIAGVWFLETVSGSDKRTAAAAVFVVTALTASWGIPMSVAALERLETVNAALVRITDVLEKYAEPGGIVIADRAVQQHLDYIGRWRLAFKPPPTAPGDGMRGRRFPGRGNMPALPRHMRPDGRSGRPGYGRGLESFAAYSGEIRRWAGDRRKAYIICGENRLRFYRDNLGEGERVTVLERIELPPGEFPGGPAPAGPPPFLKAKGGGARFPRPSRIPGGVGHDGGVMERRFGFLAGGEPLVLAEWSWEESSNR